MSYYDLTYKAICQSRTKTTVNLPHKLYLQIIFYYEEHNCRIVPTYLFFMFSLYQPGGSLYNKNNTLKFVVSYFFTSTNSKLLDLNQFKPKKNIFCVICQ